MIKIRTKRFPPEGYDCVTLWPFLFYKNELTELELAHEKYHEKQYLFCVVIGLVIFGIKYVLIGDAWNIPFMILPFALFYIAWGIGYKVKGYDKMGLEVSADKHEHDVEIKTEGSII